MGYPSVDRHTPLKTLPSGGIAYTSGNDDFLQLVDDRAVRDSERKAAIMHFSTEQATQFTEHAKMSEPEEVKQAHPRIEHVKSLSKPAHGKY